MQYFCTYSRSASNGIRRGTCCKSRCEQSTVCPVHVQARGHFWSMLLNPLPAGLLLLPPPPMFALAKLVPWMKMPTVPLLTPFALAPYKSPFPCGINCNSKMPTMAVVALTAQLSGGFFIFFFCSLVFSGWCEFSTIPEKLKFLFDDDRLNITRPASVQSTFYSCTWIAMTPPRELRARGNQSLCDKQFFPIPVRLYTFAVDLVCFSSLCEFRSVLHKSKIQTKEMEGAKKKQKAQSTNK